jgi:hypothetical protein
MRRGSLVGPLLLIGIGGLFLARNVVPDLPLLDYLAQYWPFLLILWGGLRLLEIAIWAVRGKQLPAYGVSGGEWVLVVFLCLFGLSLHAVRGFTSWLPRAGFEWGGLEVFGESYEYPVSGEVATAVAPRVVIEGFRGSARIVGSDGTAVKVNGHQTIRSMDQTTADRYGKDARVEVTSEGGQVVIRVVQTQFQGFNEDRGPFSRRITADLDITVPRGATIVAMGRDGDFDVSGIAGSVDVHGDNSSVRMENIGGDVRLDLTGSDIVRAVGLKGGFELKGRGNDIDLEKIAGQVSVDGSWGGLIQFRELAKPIRWKGPSTEMTAQALPGELRMTIGDINVSRITGPLRIDSTYTKDISITDVSGPTHIDLRRGDIRLSATSVPLSDVNVRLEAGNVELSLPENAKFNLNATTERGEGYSDYGTPVRQESDGRRGATIIGSNGGPTIEVRVTRGDINLRRAGLATSLPAQKAALPAGSPPQAVEQ